MWPSFNQSDKINWCMGCIISHNIHTAQGDLTVGNIAHSLLHCNLLVLPQPHLTNSLWKCAINPCDQYKEMRSLIVVWIAIMTEVCMLPVHRDGWLTLKELGPFFFHFFQSYGDFGTIRIVIFFWSSFWNFTPKFLCVWKKTAKTHRFYWFGGNH